MHMWWNEGWSWWNLAGMTIGMLAFWALVGWAFIAAARPGVPSNSDVDRSPEQTLAQRFAVGEIDSEEYRQRLEVLQTAQLVAR
jgi:putative membrane protein